MSRPAPTRPSAAAMLGASINYPLRGAVTWKSIVGTNVAADALSNLASPGVIGGVMIILGEDYGEGASVIQERSYAYAMKSSMWLLDPRPDLPTIVRMVEKGFELSEASHAPVMMELRIRACHVTGEFAAKNNRARRSPAATASPARRASNTPGSRIRRRCSCRSGSRSRTGCRPRCAFIREHKLNEIHRRRPRRRRHHRLRRPDQRACCARWRGSTLPISTAARACRSTCSIASIRWCRRRCATFCAGKRAVLVVEEGSPDYIEQQINVELRRADIQTRVHRQGTRCRRPANTPPTSCSTGLPAFFSEARPAGIDADAIAARVQDMLAHKPGRCRVASATCRRGRRPSAPAARNGRCSPPSS